MVFHLHSKFTLNSRAGEPAIPILCIFTRNSRKKARGKHGRKSFLDDDIKHYLIGRTESKAVPVERLKLFHCLQAINCAKTVKT